MTRITLAKRVLGTAWAAPWSSLAFLSTLVPLLVTRQIYHHSVDPEHAVIRYVARPNTRLSRVYPHHFWGITFGSFQVYSHHTAIERLASHENVHTRQSWLLGPFFPMLYFGAHMVLFAEKGDWCAAYYANPFEKHARKSVQKKGLRLL